MTPITLTVREAETEQIRALVNRTQQTHRPILLTSEETLEPMVVLLESSVFEKLQRKEQQFFQMQLRQLVQQIDLVESQWADSHAQQEFISSFPINTYTLWTLCPDEAQDLCVTLDMAARRLSLESLSSSQIEALRYCIDLLLDGAPSTSDLELCEHRLIESGIPPIMAGNDSLKQLYMDEL